MFNRLCAFTIAAAIVFSAGAARAQDSDFFLDVMPDDIVRRVTDDPAALAAASLSDTAQGAIEASLRWAPGDTVTVCFWGGSQALRQRIAQTASAWNQVGANIRLDFGNAADPTLCRAGRNFDVRVGYGYAGYWSYVGRDSIIKAGMNETSLNLANFDTAPPIDGDTFMQVVLHEFGHALGFRHEHQHPAATCDAEFNWPVIYNYLTGPPNNWSREKIDRNMRPRPDNYYSSVISTAFDRQSIMLYTFKPEFYLNAATATCYAPRNTSLSALDRETLLRAYHTSSAGVDAGAAATVLSEAAGVDLPAAQRVALTERLALSQFGAAELRSLSEWAGGEALGTVGLSSQGVAPGSNQSAQVNALVDDRFFVRRGNRIVIPSTTSVQSALARAVQSQANQ